MVYKRRKQSRNTYRTIKGYTTSDGKRVPSYKRKMNKNIRKKRTIRRK